MPDIAFTINGTPHKRLFRSIIADYDLRTSICELVDNALDHWTANDRSTNLVIELFLNLDRQLITIKDNAGGVPKEQIELLVIPGASRDESDYNFIGNFGVGGKRAGIALGQRVEVSTRHGAGKTYRFVLSDDWLSTDTWDVDVQEISDLAEATTNVSISSLRQGFSGRDVDNVRSFLEETYAKFLGDDCIIKINGSLIGRTTFDNWSYPPDYPPNRSCFNIFPDDGQAVAIILTAGLISDRDPAEENYGAYFYCNDRMILAHDKSHEVGFYKGEAGVPHPDASLCRVLVELIGPPELMPWNSSKTSINWSHPTFLEIRERIVALSARFSKISRRLKNNRDEEVFAHQTGSISEIDLAQKGTEKRVIDLPLPRARKKAYLDRILDKNSAIIQDQPWTLGLVEAMGVADSISRKRLHTRNRLALIILDSNLEIGIKEFIVHRADIFRPDKFGDAVLLEMFRRRHEVINAVKPHIQIDDVTWTKVNHYYERRNKLTHERATVQITDAELDDYREVVERVLLELFKLQL